MAVPESSVDPTRPIQNVNNNKKNDKNKDKKVIIAAQEIKYAKCLAGNEKKTRDKALKSLTKWLHQRCIALPLTEADFMLLWKGLFYSMWMSDKPLVQEECAESISKLIHSLKPNSRMMFFKCGLRTLGNEWFGIDQLRLDKFLMLVRRMLRQGFVAMKQQNWSMKTVREFQQLLEDTILSNKKKVSLGLSLHFTEIYLEELAKVSRGEFHPMLLIEFLVPFTKQLVGTNDNRQIQCITKNIFKHLMKQSDSGLEYNEKFHAWKRMGFPGGNIDCLQESVASDEEENSSDVEQGMSDNEKEDDGEKPLDPRAGRVDVDLPQLKFNPKHMIALLTKYRFSPDSNTKSRKAINKLISDFTEMMHGRFPLGLKKVELNKDDNSTKLKQSVNRLVKFEKNIMQISNKRKAIDDRVDEQPPQKKQKSQKHKIEEQTNGLMKKLKQEVNAKPKKVKKIQNEDDSDDSIPAEELYKNFDSAFQRNSGMWYVYNADNENASETGENKSEDESRGITEEQGSGDDENFSVKQQGVKRRKTKKPVKWNKDCSIQLIPESLKSPKRKSPQKSNGFDEKDNSDINIPEGKSFNGLVEQQNEATVSPQKAKDIIESGKVLDSPQKVFEKIESNKSPPKLKTSPEKVRTPTKSPEKCEGIESSPKKKNIDSPIRKNKHSPDSNAKSKSPKLQNGTIMDTQLSFEPEVESTPQKNLFQQTEWDSPLKDGEIEFFVMSNKHKEKMSKLANQSGENMSELVKRSLSKIKGKNHRASLDPKLVRNPFSMYGTPKSGKKVKIDLRLNKSQEIHEHEATIKRSPAIPFDANRKPVKPLLKPNAVTSPIDPFYRRRLNL